MTEKLYDIKAIREEVVEGRILEINYPTPLLKVVNVQTDGGTIELSDSDKLKVYVTDDMVNKYYRIKYARTSSTNISTSITKEFLNIRSIQPINAPLTKLVLEIEINDTDKVATQITDSCDNNFIDADIINKETGERFSVKKRDEVWKCISNARKKQRS